ncbi:MAG: type I-C CRISPR-associated protein Cas7/Csd2 [Parvularculaceae bacterium]
MTAIENRYEFVYFFDVANGNPNGDPDAGNLPRLDPETNRGLVTDVCLKRKVRNFIQMAKGDEPGFEIYMQERGVLNNQHKRAWEAVDISPEKKDVYKQLPKDEAKARELTAWMCANFFDIRAFGAVMTTDVNCGQVRGPVQFTFGESVEPVVPLEISITRSSVTNERDIEKERTMGRKHIVPYGLYRAHGFISARLANDPKKGTGFSDNDLELFWTALKTMFDHDRSAARGEMNARKLFAFKHDSDLGSAPAHRLFDTIKIARRHDGAMVPIAEAAAKGAPPARSFSDYEIWAEEDKMPAGVTLLELL